MLSSLTINRMVVSVAGKRNSMGREGQGAESKIVQLAETLFCAKSQKTAWSPKSTVRPSARRRS
jgi:hypothetical protein